MFSLSLHGLLELCKLVSAAPAGKQEICKLSTLDMRKRTQISTSIHGIHTLVQLFPFAIWSIPHNGNGKGFTRLYEPPVVSPPEATQQNQRR